MKKSILIGSIMLMLFTTNISAGGLLTNTNQHIAFLRQLARDASMDIDAVYSNPAGLAFLSKDGFHLSLNVQNASQTRTIYSSYAPFLMNADGATSPDGSRKYKGEATAPFVPSIQAAYKKGNWTFSGSFAVTGGGGKATFNNGLGSFESQVAVIPIMLNQAGIKASQYAVDSYMSGTQMIFGVQLGATYKFTDYLSGFVGARVNYVKNGYEGHIKNIQANIGPNGELVNLNQYFSQASEQARQAALSYQIAGDVENAARYEAMAVQFGQTAAMTADKNLDCTQNGWGITPIIGADFRWNKWNVGVKYEFNTKLNVENKTKIDDTGLFSDGVNTPHDIPSLLTVGVMYEILPVLRASVGYHHFFDTHARMAKTTDPETGNAIGKQHFINHGTNEYLAGIEWDICKWAQISGGMQRTKYDLEPNYMSDMSFTTSSYSFGVGAGFNIMEDLKLNIAYFWTNYDTYNKTTANLNNTGQPMSDSFTRTNKVFGIGVDYRF